MVLIGTTDLENVPNALRFHAEHKEHCLGLYEQNTRLPIQLSALWHRLIRSAAAARKSMPVFLLGARRWTWPDHFLAVANDHDHRDVPNGSPIRCATTSA